MGEPKTIAFFPEGAFGPALDSVGIARACRELGHNPVFICDPMQEENGAEKSARLLDKLATEHG